MGFKEGFSHYADGNSGHYKRGVKNKAQKILERKGISISRGELSLTQRMAMNRPTTTGKRSHPKI